METETGRYRTIQLILIIGGLITSLLFSLAMMSPSIAAVEDHTSPKIANYYLKWTLTEAEARELARWDLVILDMEIQARYSNLLKQMRVWNPDIVLLAYITPQEIIKDAAGSFSQMRRKLAAAIDSSWYLTNSRGERLTWWPGTYLLNVTNDARQVNGRKWNTYLAQFISDELLSSGLWDGVFYDNTWDNVTFFVGEDVDANRDGLSDGRNADAKWIEGMRAIYEETRRLAGEKYLIVGNGTTREYAGQLNGKMVENFLPEAWAPSMRTYALNGSQTQTPRVNIINRNTANRGTQNDFRAMRFGLGSALLENGYYSFDFGDQDHGQIWWYDEYAVGLGDALGASESERGFGEYQPDVWRRDFANGLSLVNSTPNRKSVPLDGDFEKIHGTQDTRVNDGSIVSEVEVPAYDGLVLLKTFETPEDILFENGAFLRFFRADGTKARNGFFAFDETQAGGKQVARIDLNGNGKRELVVASDTKLEVYRDDGLLYMRAWPYTANYKGTLSVAVGDVNDDGRGEIYVAPSAGYALPIQVYSRHGGLYRQDWYPFGRGYRGGYSVAVREVADRPWENELVIGVGKGVRPMVHAFNRSYELQRSWLAFESSFTGGIDVAAGDVDGDGTDEVIVGAGPGKKPLIRIFDPFGNRLFGEIIVYSASNLPGIRVEALDVDFDGRDDVVGMSSGL